MSTFLLYIARSSLYLAIFYSFFLLVMRRTTFFRLNRILLLVGTLACFLLPLLRIRPASAAKATWFVLSPEIASTAEGTAAKTAFSGIPISAILLSIWLLGAATVLFLTARSYFKMRKMIRQGEARQQPDGTILVLTEQDQPSFSWGRTIVMSCKDAAENPAILLHEQMHIHHRHSLDLLLYSLCTAAHWFNPLVWITRTELKLLHEYEADDSVLDQGIDATQYQLLLVRKAVGEQRFSLANGFQHSKLKNRIAMMLSSPTSRKRQFAWLLLIPVLAVAMYACNPSRNESEPAPAEETVNPAGGVPINLSTPSTESVPFSVIDKKPTFNGGDANEFSKWVNAHLTYPEEAKQKEIQGRVTLSFKVCADGKVRDARVLRGVDPLLDAEALRVISASPDWGPGEQDGKAVDVTYTFPVVFQLR